MGACTSSANSVAPSQANGSTLHRDTKGAGAGSLRLSESDANFRTMVYKKRRLSDATLERIVSDPVVSEAFKTFLRGELGEHKLLFWFDADKYRQLPPDTPVRERQEAACRIFEKYLSGGSDSGFDIELDGATREQIIQVLDIKPLSGRESGRYKVNCSDPVKLKQAFIFASLKTFQDIKFSYLPVFMTSPHFADLRGDQGFFRDANDAAEKAGDFLQQMDISFILSHPLGNNFLMKFVEEANLLEGNGPVFADLFAEVAHFESENNPTNRTKRLERMVRRYRQVQLPALQQVLADSAKYLEGGRDAPPLALFDKVKSEVVALFAEHEAAFKEHHLFRTMTTNIATSSIKDYSKASGFDARVRTKNTIKAMEAFSAARNLQSVEEEEITLDKVMGNSQGLVFFKRFVVQNFMEDSILFWTRVAKFKEKVEELGASNDPAMLLKLGSSIVDDFLLPDSPMLVNISNEMREQAVRQFQDDSTRSADAFDKAQREVFQLLKHNLWKKFQTTPRFMYLKERFREREFIKETQGRVGQTQLEAGTEI